MNNPMEISKYDGIARWYDELRRDDSVSLVDNLVFPYVFSLIEPNKKPYVCDLACGQGKLSRFLAQQGAQVLGVDISANLLDIAKKYEKTKPLGITYLLDNAEKLSKLNDLEFEGVVCHMALMDISDLDATYRAVFRVLKRSGWFAFSITHPCFESPHAKWGKTHTGEIKREIFEYFQERFWRSRNPNGMRGQMGAHHRKLSTYINLLIQAGFTITQMIEPQATKEELSWVPGYAVTPAFLILQARK